MAEAAEGRWREPNTLVALAALAVTAMAIFVGPLITTELDRADSIRAERRAEYARFLETVERCGSAQQESATSMSEARRDLTVAEPSDVAEIEAAFEREGSAAQNACRADLGRSVEVIALLAGRQEVEVRARALLGTLLDYRSSVQDDVRNDLAIAVDRITNASSGTVPPSTTETTPSEPSGRTERCGLDPDDAAVVEECLDRFVASYTAFRQTARDDVQSPGFWSADLWFRLLLPLLAFVLVVGVIVLGLWSRAGRDQRA